MSEQRYYTGDDGVLYDRGRNTQAQFREPAPPVENGPKWPEIDESVMSNFDHDIDEKVAERLRKEEVVSQYAGWNFCGYVWWNREAETFRCEVWQYQSPLEIVSGTLPEIMDEVSDRYGDE